MNESSPKSPLSRTVLLFIILGVLALGVIFVVLATIGDDVPNKLAPATATSPGN